VTCGSFLTVGNTFYIMKYFLSFFSLFVNKRVVMLDIKILLGTVSQRGMW